MNNKVGKKERGGSGGRGGDIVGDHILFCMLDTSSAKPFNL